MFKDVSMALCRNKDGGKTIVLGPLLSVIAMSITVSICWHSELTLNYNRLNRTKASITRASLSKETDR